MKDGRVEQWRKIVEGVISKPADHFDPWTVQGILRNDEKCLDLRRRLASDIGMRVYATLVKGSLGGDISVEKVYSELDEYGDSVSVRGFCSGAKGGSFVLQGRQRFKDGVDVRANVQFFGDPNAGIEEVRYGLDVPHKNSFLGTASRRQLSRFLKRKENSFAKTGTVKGGRSFDRNRDARFEFKRNPSLQRNTARMDVLVDSGEERVLIPEFNLNLTPEQAIALLKRRINDILGFTVC